jgi:hypothetical protein
LLPQFSSARWQECFGKPDKVAHQGLWLWAKRQLNAASSAKQIRNDGILASLYPLEKQRRSLSLDNTAVNLCGFEVWINFSFDCDEVFFAGEYVEKCPQISMHALRV